MRIRFLFSLATLVVATTQIDADDRISPEAKAYLDAVLKIMQEHFV
jgi:hypothetical protein